MNNVTVGLGGPSYTAGQEAEPSLMSLPGDRVPRPSPLSRSDAEHAVDKPGKKQLPTVTLSFPSGSLVKNTPASAGDAGSTPGQENPLEEERATHSSILAGRIPWTEDYSS